MLSVARFIRNAASRSPDRRFAAVAIASRWLLQDYPLIWNQIDWFRDEAFGDYLARFGETRGFNNHRKWMLWQLTRLVANVPGDTAECGVFEGASSWLICAASQRDGRKGFHHLFDSFEGLSAPSDADGAYWKAHDMAAGEGVVSRNLDPFRDMLAFHKGWIPDRFGEAENRTFAFVHIDVDLYQPTLDSVRFFYDRLSPGGIVLCDDYGFSTCPGATRAMDEFLTDKPEKMLALDAGGGFFIKGVTTAAGGDPLAAVRKR